KRAHTRAMSTEGVNVGGQADAQRSGHTMNANASSARAGNTAQVGSNYARGENEMARVQEEGQTLNSKNASAAEQVHTSLMRSPQRSDEHTSELQSRFELVCRLLLGQKKSITDRETSRP